jgi:hypothetical protein
LNVEDFGDVGSAEYPVATRPMSFLEAEALQEAA